MTKNLGVLFIDGEESLTDQSESAHSVTNFGTVISTDEKRFGDSSIYFNGSSHLTIANSNDWTFDSGDFTIDFWINFENSASSNMHLVEQNDGVNRWQFWRDGSVWRFYSNSGVNFEFSDSLVTGTWYHVALVRKDLVFYIFRDGNLLGTNNATSNLNNMDGPLYIGKYATATSFFKGHLDNIRIIKGTGLWTEAFDPTSLSDLFLVDPLLASSFYNIGRKGNLRGKAKAGFIRPTIKQFFTSKNFSSIEKILSLVGYSDDLCVIPMNAFADEGETGDAWGASKAFDNTVGTHSSGNSFVLGSGSTNKLGHWLAYDFGNGNTKSIEKYTITAPTDISTITPKDWYFQGSNDRDTGFVTLDTRVNEVFSNGQKKEYEFTNNTPYRYYRIYVNANNNPTYWWEVAISEMEMMEGIYEY